MLKQLTDAKNHVFVYKRSHDTIVLTSPVKQQRRVVTVCRRVQDGGHFTIVRNECVSAALQQQILTALFSTRTSRSARIDQDGKKIAEMLTSRLTQQHT